MNKNDKAFRIDVVDVGSLSATSETTLLTALETPTCIFTIIVVKDFVVHAGQNYLKVK